MRGGQLSLFGSAALSSVVFVFGAGSARAEPATPRREVELVVERAPGLEACPDAAAMRDLVAARLGYDPVVAGSSTLLVVRFAPEPPGIRATLQRRTAGDLRGTRTMRSETGDCVELASSVALAAALAIDPEASPRPVPLPPSPSPPLPSPPPSQAAPPEPPAPVVAPPRREPPPERDTTPTPTRVAIGAGPVVGAGHVPGLSVGPRFDVAARRGALSLELQGTALVEGSQVARAGTVSASAFIGSLLPCLRWSAGAVWSGDACIEGQLGGLFASSKSVDRTEPITSVISAVGLRGSIERSLTQRVAVRLSVSGVAQLSHVHLFIDDAGSHVDVWSTPPVAFLVGVEPLLILP